MPDITFASVSVLTILGFITAMAFAAMVSARGALQIGAKRQDPGWWQVALPHDVAEDQVASFPKTKQYEHSIDVLGGLHAGTVEFQLSYDVARWGNIKVQRPVIITNMSIVVNEVIDGDWPAYVHSPPASDSFADLIGFRIVDGVPQPAVEVQRDMDDEWTNKPYFRGKRCLRVPDSDPPVVLIEVVGKAVAWQLKIDYAVGHKQNSVMWPRDPRDSIRTAPGMTKTSTVWLCGVAAQPPQYLIREEDEGLWEEDEEPWDED